MTPQEKAKELIDTFSGPVRTSDLHVPSFITGVECADGSPEYVNILEEETIDVAKSCALICVEEIIRETIRLEEETRRFWIETKKAIEKL